MKKWQEFLEWCIHSDEGKAAAAEYEAGRCNISVVLARDILPCVFSLLCATFVNSHSHRLAVMFV